MPWEPMSKQDLRLEFVVAATREGANVRELCRRHGISAKTGYKWIARFRELGDAGLMDQSRRPKSSPRRSNAPLEHAVLGHRKEHPAWGGRKIRAVLIREGTVAPAASTITQILRRHGEPIGQFGGGEAAFTRFEREHPNELWQMDFKGWVRLADGRQLFPLTILDDHSRMAMALKACPDQQTDTVWQALVPVFRFYGLPFQMITDNGPPWGNGPGSPYTPLGVMLIDQGIRLSHSRPYHPQTLGKDERFHRSLKAEVLSRPCFASFQEATQAFDAWRHIYNHKRPHEALDMAVPAERYSCSPRQYQDAIKPFEYAPADELRAVHEGGHISFKGHRISVPKAFAGRKLALRPTENDRVYDVVYRHQRLGNLDLSAEAVKFKPVTHVSEQA